MNARPIFDFLRALQKIIKRDGWTCTATDTMRCVVVLFHFWIDSIGETGCFPGGGMWHPSREHLNSIREAIDYNGGELKEIIEDNRFKEVLLSSRS